MSHKPVVHMTKNALRRLRNEASLRDLEFNPGVIAIVCGESMAVTVPMNVVTMYHPLEAYKRVTCPLCIIAMDSDE